MELVGKLKVNGESSFLGRFCLWLSIIAKYICWRQSLFVSKVIIRSTATPAAATFCWQLLEQFVRKGEASKTTFTAAQLRRGVFSGALLDLLLVFANSGLDLSVLELQGEIIDDLCHRFHHR